MVKLRVAPFLRRSASHRLNYFYRLTGVGFDFVLPDTRGKMANDSYHEWTCIPKLLQLIVNKLFCLVHTYIVFFVDQVRNQVANTLLGATSVVDLVEIPSVDVCVIKCRPHCLRDALVAVGSVVDGHSVPAELACHVNADGTERFVAAANNARERSIQLSV